MANYDKETQFYWLQLKEDFFDEDAIDWLEEQPNGKEYSLFYLKLCLKSLRTNGLLIRNVGTVLIPYDYVKLGEITKTHPDTVVVAMELLMRIGLIERLKTGEFYLTQVEEMIGKQSKGAFKKQMQIRRRKIEELSGGQGVEKIPPTIKGGQGVDKCPPKNKGKNKVKKISPTTKGGQGVESKVEKIPPTIKDGQEVEKCPPTTKGGQGVEKIPPELELELDKELDIEREATNPKNRICAPTLEEVKAYCEERKNNIDAERFINYYEAKGWMLGKDSIKNWRALILNWEKVEKQNVGVTKTYTTEELNAMFDNLTEDDL